MCGIIGEIARDPIDIDLFVAMRDEQEHRGPDGAGLYTNETETVALGSRRLSIIDISDAGDQPISNETSDVWVTYNGELYNYRSLRDTLQTLGHEFTSETDTEVIVHAYEEWGTNCVERIRGMFGFALWDEREERLFAARDRLGIKPFYYYDGDSRFVFASELKSIVYDRSIPREIDPEAVRQYLLYRYVPAPHSIWQDVRKLRPGHLLVYEDGQAHIEEYWNLSEAVEARRDEDDPEEAVLELLDDAVEEHLVSDVPLSVLLSGGIDSSLITALACRHTDSPTTYSLGFDRTVNELPYARVVADAFDTDHVERLVSPDDLDDLIDSLVYYYDEPIGDSSIFPTFLLMENISREYKVALSGDGGDELFAGYDWYARFNTYQQLQRFGPVFSLADSILGLVPDRLNNRYVDAVKQRLEPFSLTGLDRYRHVMAPRFTDDDVRSLLSADLVVELGDDQSKHAEHAADTFDTVTELQRFDAETFLVDDILVKVDRASMANSLEVRVPFLDHRLVEYALSLDEEIAFADGEKKHLLKRVARRLLPSKILDRGKQGFSAPLDDLGFIEENLDVLENSRAAADGIFDPVVLDDLLTNSTGSNRDRAKLWLLIEFELWYREWRPRTG